MRRGPALLAYLSLCVPLGIAAHLGAEFAGLGRDADDVAFSARHLYLLVLAVAAFAGFLVAVGAFGRSAERRRRAGLIARALPLRGSGPGFLALSAAVQFGFFLLTQFGEGCPLCRGDLGIGMLAALLASVAGACVLAALRRHVARAIALHAYRSRRSGLLFVRRPARRAAPARRATYATFARTLGSRPPPRLSAA